MEIQKGTGLAASRQRDMALRTVSEEGNARNPEIRREGKAEPRWGSVTGFRG